jgi:hypothetical protein
MKKILIVIAVLAAVAAAVGAVGLAYAQTATPPAAKTGSAAAATPAAGTQCTCPCNSPEGLLAGYMDAQQAKLLGMTEAEYQAQEDAGKTWLEIATARGKTAAEAQTLLETAYSNAIAQALVDGRITQAQADALKALPASDPEMGGRGPGGGHGGMDGNFIVHTYLEEAFAKALGMTIEDFDAQEAAGKSWSEIAVAQGKTETQAETLLQTAYSQSIDQALADGKITQAQADALKAAAAPTLANVGIPGHGQPGGMDNGQPGGPGGRGPAGPGGPGGNGSGTAPTDTTTTPSTNP